MTSSFNKRQRLIRRCKRLLDRVFYYSMDIHTIGVRSEYMEILHYIEELFPVDVKSPHGHGL